MRRRTAAGSAVFLMMYMLAVVLIAPSTALAEPQDNPEFPTTTCGGEWHWIHNQLPEGVVSGTLTVEFEELGVVQVDSTYNGSVLHYTLQLEEGDTLISASDDVEGGKLVLSHWPDCEGTTTTTEAETTTTTEADTTTTTEAGTTTTSTEVSPTTTALIPASVGAGGKCSEAPGQLGKGELAVTVTPAGGATVTINGKTFTSSGGIVGVEDESTYSWSAVANPGHVLTGVTGGSVTMPKCDVAVLGTVLESSTTVAAVSASTLPFTGFELENTLLLAGAALMSGVGLLLLTVGKDEEEPATVHDRW
jgi:hypothetical protein